MRMTQRARNIRPDANDVKPLNTALLEALRSCFSPCAPASLCSSGVPAMQTAMDQQSVMMIQADTRANLTARAAAKERKALEGLPKRQKHTKVALAETTETDPCASTGI